MKLGSENGSCIKHIFRFRKTLFVCSVFILLASACGKDKTEMVGLKFDPETTPVVHTEGVATLISDSGITRYRMQTKVWDVYSKAKEPFWRFPEKIYMERFDTLFNVEGSIEADTAYYFMRKKIWKLIGNVKVLNLEGETFETSELYWEQRRGEFYTDKFVRVLRKDEEITGIGFRSNQEMTDFSFYKSGVLLNVKEDNSNDTIP